MILPEKKRKKNNPIPEPTLRRIPKYYRYLLSQQYKGIQYISATTIAEFTQFKPIQVRKDLQIAGAVGRPKIGYEMNSIIKTLESFLGYDNITESFLVGVGHLGTALLNHGRFDENGVSIVVAFDNDPEKVDTTISGIHIKDVKKFKNLAQRMNIKVGIISVPEEHVQETCDMMVDAGIKAILNLCSTPLKVPEGVIVHSENIGVALALLIKKL